MRNYVDTKGKDKRSKRLNALGLPLYMNTKTHGETQKTRRNDGWNAGMKIQTQEHGMSDSPGRRTTERRGEESNWKKRARKLEGASRGGRSRRPLVITLGRRRWSLQLGEVEQNLPPCSFFHSGWSGAEQNDWCGEREGERESGGNAKRIYLSSRECTETTILSLLAKFINYLMVFFLW